jgi:Tol biopolymer transport system component
VSNSSVNHRGTLARIPVTGGAARELVDDVQFADWSPDGKELAVVKEVDRKWRLEFPIGHVLYETSSFLDNPRVSPRGDLVAFFEGSAGTAVGSNWIVAVVDKAGRRRALSNGRVVWWWGLAWSPAGNEIWFTGSEIGFSAGLYAVDLNGHQRLITEGPGALELHDVSRSGRVLLARTNVRASLLVATPAQPSERDLSWHDGSIPTDLTSDGKTMVLRERGDAGATLSVYVRSTDGSAAVPLGEGEARSLSPDGKWVVVWNPRTSQLSMLPTGAGQPRQLNTGQLEFVGWTNWFPNGERILFSGREPGHKSRLYTLPVRDGERRTITAEGVDFLPDSSAISAGHAISPDGRFVVAFDSDRKPGLYPTDGGEPRALSGLSAGEMPINWTIDGRSLYVYRPGELPARVFIVDASTGRRTLWKEFAPRDRTGAVAGIGDVKVTPDGRSYVYSYYQFLSDLFLVDGLK